MDLDGEGAAVLEAGEQRSLLEATGAEGNPLRTPSIDDDVDTSSAGQMSMLYNILTQRDNDRRPSLRRARYAGLATLLLCGVALLVAAVWSVGSETSEHGVPRDHTLASGLVVKASPWSGATSDSTSSASDASCTDNYCTDRSSGSITGSQEHLMSLCDSDSSCMAVDYRAIGGYGHLCSSTQRNPPSSGYVFCAKSAFRQARAVAHAYEAQQDASYGSAYSPRGDAASDGYAVGGAAGVDAQAAGPAAEASGQSLGWDAGNAQQTVDGQFQDYDGQSSTELAVPGGYSMETSVTSTFTTSTSTHLTDTTLTSTNTTSLQPSTSTSYTTTSTHMPTLFCFALMMPKGYEVDLLKQLVAQSAGIFACENYSVFSNDEFYLSHHPKIKTENIGSVECQYGGPWHLALNTEIFLRVWKKVFHDKVYLDGDWTVKVDPDAVFLPHRLRLRVMDRSADDEIYLNNCDQGLHGPIEVVARGGMKVFADGVEDCHKSLEHEWDWTGEDVFLRHCLGMLKVNRVDDFHLLTEMVCFYEDPIADGCVTGKVAFHPFKTTENYFKCLNEAHNATEEDAKLAEIKRQARQKRIEARDKAKAEGKDPNKIDEETTTPAPDVCEDDNEGAIRMAAGLRVDSAGCIEMSDMCQNPPEQYGPQVRKYCRKTCNLCGPGSMAPPMLDQVPPEAMAPPVQPMAPMAQPQAPVAPAVAPAAPAAAAIYPQGGAAVNVGGYLTQ